MNTFPGEAWAAVAAVPAIVGGAAPLTRGDRPVWVRTAAAGASVALAGAVLYGLARAGRHVEQCRDLG